MPAFDAWEDLRDQIHEDIREAWSPSRIFDGRPVREVSASEKVAVLELAGFDQQQGANRYAIQLPRFIVTLVAPRPAGSVAILDQIIEDANALIEKLEASHRYAGVLMNPMAGITPRPLEEQIEAASGTYQVSVDFVGMISSEYNPGPPQT